MSLAVKINLFSLGFIAFGIFGIFTGGTMSLLIRIGVVSFWILTGAGLLARIEKVRRFAFCASAAFMWLCVFVLIANGALILFKGIQGGTLKESLYSVFALFVAFGSFAAVFFFMQKFLSGAEVIASFK